MVHAPSIEALDAFDLRHVVLHAGRKQNLARGRAEAVGASDGEAVTLWYNGDGAARTDRHGLVALELRPPAREKIARGQAFVAEQTVDTVRRSVAGLPLIDEQDAAPAAPEHERRAEACCAAADNHDIVCCGHSPSPRPLPSRFGHSRFSSKLPSRDWTGNALGRHGLEADAVISWSAPDNVARLPLANSIARSSRALAIGYLPHGAQCCRDPVH